MKDLFPGYYKPTDEEFKSLWEKGIFVFDTNFLLDLYRYSEQTCTYLLNIVEELGDRVWIPYHVCKEYHKNLNYTIATQVSKYEESIKTLLSFRKQIDEKRSHSFLTQQLHAEIIEFCQKIDVELSSKKNIVKELLVENPNKIKLAELLQNKIGKPFTADELSQIYEEGESRYLKKIPPGYLDSKKPNPDRYGDLIIWKEILRKNSTINCPIIFVTNDKKEDWFLEELGFIIGPRPELVDEFIKTRADLIYFYRTDQFLKYASTYLSTPEDAEAVKEIGEIISQNREDSKSESTNHENTNESSTLNSDSKEEINIHDIENTTSSESSV